MRHGPDREGGEGGKDRLGNRGGGRLEVSSRYVATICSLEGKN